MTDVGEFEFRIYDSWDSGIPITDSMMVVTQSTLVMANIFALIRDILEGVLR
jgi:hypothetical protein